MTKTATNNDLLKSASLKRDVEDTQDEMVDLLVLMKKIKIT